MSRYEHLLACYVSEQMTEEDWQWHLETDELLRAWLSKLSKRAATMAYPFASVQPRTGL